MAKQKTVLDYIIDGVLVKVNKKSLLLKTDENAIDKKFVLTNDTKLVEIKLSSKNLEFVSKKRIKLTDLHPEDNVSVVIAPEDPDKKSPPALTVKKIVVPI